MRLERVNQDRGELRFYEVSIEPTLFDDHALCIRWGRIGRKSRHRIAETGDIGTVTASAKRAILQKTRRGYVQSEGK